MSLSFANRVKEALDRGKPVVALESTVITHGLPRPQNLQLAAALEEEVRRHGAEPATIGIIKGRIIVGLDAEQLALLAAEPADKASLWNLAAISTRGANAGTTVAATLHIAALAGISVFATGGVGGVHPAPFDESTDLIALARYPLITVSAGAKSILDTHATFERLETLGVPVIAYRSPNIAGFHLPQSDWPASGRADDPAEVAAIWAKQQELQLNSGLLLSNPVSSGLEAAELEAWTAQATRDAAAAGIHGKDTTPFLLARLAELSAGRTVEVNLRLLHENSALAAQVATQVAARKSGLPASGLEAQA
jgi:pseudouridine-5'-phosphate glycosidase